MNKRVLSLWFEVARRCFLIGFVLLACASCAAVVPLPDLPIDPATKRPTLKSVVRRITCELWESLYASDRHFEILTQDDYDVAMQLSLTIDEGGSLAPNLTYVESPLLSVNIGANVNRSRDQNYFQALSFSMRALDQEYKYRRDVRKQDIASYCGTFDTDLAGNLGIREAIELAITAIPRLKEDKTTLSDTSGSFGGYVNFTVTKNLNMIGPTWMLRHFRGPGSLAGISEMNTDKLTFAFAKGEASSKFYAGIRPRRNETAERLLAQINVNQLSTQLGNLNMAFRQ